MKNYILLLIAALFMLSLSSCGKKKKEILGEWQVTKKVNADCDDPNANGEDLTIANNCANATDDCSSIRYNFKDDDTYSTTGTILFIDLGFPITGTFSGIYNYDGKTLEVCDGNDCNEGELSVDGDVATYTFNDGECEVTLTMMKQ